MPAASRGGARQRAGRGSPRADRPSRAGSAAGDVVDQDRGAPWRDQPPQVTQGRLQVGQVVQGGRAQHQIEPRRIGDGHKVADLVADVGMGALVAGDVDQRLAAVDAHDLIEAVGQGQGVAA